MIFQALVEGTRARPGRRVRVINVGLEPEEALEMDLPVEEFEPKKRTVPVADYVPPEWREWLQTKWVELDAMEPTIFLSWLDEKMEDYGGKLVPPTSVLRDRLGERVKGGLRERLTAEAIRVARADERTEAAYAGLRPRLDALDGELEKKVNHHLDKRPEHHWTNPLDRVASGLVKSDCREEG